MPRIADPARRRARRDHAVDVATDWLSILFGLAMFVGLLWWMLVTAS